MPSKIYIKLKSILIQNSYVFIILILWFLCNYIAFLILTNDFIEAFFILFFFKNHPSMYGNFYANFSEFIIFGLVFSLVTIDLFRKYNPADTCRKLAMSHSNHVVIIGYNHIGQRIADFLKEKGESVVIIERKKEIIQNLIDNEEAVVNGDALNFEVLLDAGIDKAKAVLIMSDNLEVLMVITAHVRQLNKRCKLVCRVFEDDIGELISKTYNAEIISTSKFTAEIIIAKIIKNHYKNILLIGMNNITARLMKRLENLTYINFCLIEENEELIEDYSFWRDNIVVGDPKDHQILNKVGIENVDFIFNSIPVVTESILIIRRIREINKNCKIYARFFNDNVAELLEKHPFSTKVISSSKYTLNVIEKKGLLNLSHYNL